MFGQLPDAAHCIYKDWGNLLRQKKWRQFRLSPELSWSLPWTDRSPVVCVEGIRIKSLSVAMLRVVFVGRIDVHHTIYDVADDIACLIVRNDR